jgi:hypothetical protein
MPEDSAITRSRLRPSPFPLSFALCPLPFALLTVAFGCLVLQVTSASLQKRDFTSPNAATMIARAVVERGEFAAHAWPRTRTTAAGVEEPLRAFHLPAEPLLIAAGLRVLPAALLPYLHLPIAVLFVTAVAAVGFRIGGRPCGYAAGAVASLDPFVVAHGPVWDDTFLAAALEWTIFAVLVRWMPTAGKGPAPPADSIRPASIGLVAVLSAAAALTRSSSQAILAVIALVLIARPVFRPLRAAGWAMILGIAAALIVWGVRNDRVLGEFQIGSSHDGITLFESNYATARPSLLRTGVVESYTLDDLREQFDTVAPMSEFDADRYFKREAMTYAGNEPLDVLTTGGLKLLVSLSGVNPGRPLASPRNLVALAANAFLVAAGVYGWRRLRVDREWLDAGLLASLCLAVLTITCLGLLAGPSGMRYRLDATGFLYLGAAAAIISAARPRTASRRRA